MIEPAQNIEAERAVLGAIIVNTNALAPVAEVLSIAGVAAFLSEAHQSIYTAMLELDEAGSPIDEVTLTTQMRDNGDLEAAGGAAYTSGLYESTPTSANAVQYAELVLECWKRRMVAELFHKGALRVRDGTLDSEYTERIQRFLDSGRNGSSIRPLGDIARSVASTLRRIACGEETAGIATGYTDLDFTLAGGLKAGTVAIIAGFSGEGKTTFAFNIAYRVAKAGTPVLFFSLEMTDESLTEKLLQIDSGINVNALRNRRGADGELNRLDEAVARVTGLPIHLDDLSESTIGHIRGRVLDFVKTNPRALIIVDYLQLVIGVRRNSDSREVEVAGISRALKMLAKKTGVAMIALSQLNDDGYMRESRAIKQDADVVMKISRPDKPKKGEPAVSENVTILNIEKHRAGRTGNHNFYFDKEMQRFSEVDKNAAPPTPPRRYWQESPDDEQEALLPGTKGV